MHKLGDPFSSLCDFGDWNEGDLPDLTKPGTQGCFLAMIGETNIRRSRSDAMHNVAHAMGRGLSIEAALVYVLEHTHRDWQPAL